MKFSRLVAILSLVLLTALTLPVLVLGETMEEQVILILPESSHVQGNQLLLGEIAELEGPAELVAQIANVNAGTAPQPGARRRLTQGHIQTRLMQAGIPLGMVEFQGASIVQVYGLAQTPIQTSPKTEETANGFPVYEVVVAARSLRKGEILTYEDLAIEGQEFKSTQPDGRTLEEFIGLRTSRQIISGHPLTTLNVEVIPAIERGNQVTIVVQTGGLVVTAPGVAEGSGAIGETISVRNTLSRQLVQGEILDSETVVVNLRGSGTP